MDQEDEKSDISLARRFANLFRFINDLNALNDGGEFEWSFKRIFLPNLYSRRKSNKKISFLDLLIKNERKKKKSAFIWLCDKKDDFPFYIATMHYLRSNIPPKMF